MTDDTYRGHWLRRDGDRLRRAAGHSRCRFPDRLHPASVPPRQLPAGASRRGEHRARAGGRPRGAGTGRQLLHRPITPRATCPTGRSRRCARASSRAIPAPRWSPAPPIRTTTTSCASRGPSIFFQTPVTAFLTKHGVDTTIVMGCMTSGLYPGVGDRFLLLGLSHHGAGGLRRRRGRAAAPGQSARCRPALTPTIVSSEQVLDYLDEIRKRNA